MNISEHICQLLQKHDCVVVPGWGGFIARKQPAQIVHGLGRMLPPSKRLAFNQALQQDDGLLAKSLSISENISYAEAINYISEYVVKGHQTLHTERIWKLNGIGTFYLNSEFLVQFNYDAGQNFSKESYGLEPVLLPSKISKKESSPTIQIQYKSIETFSNQPKKVTVGKQVAVKPWLRIASLLAFATFIGLLEQWPMQPRMNQAGFNMLEWFSQSNSKETTSKKNSTSSNIKIDNGVLSGDSTYFLIAGKFPSIRAAGEAVDLLKKAGYPAELTIKVDGLTLVSAIKSGKKDELERYGADIRHLMNQETFILALSRQK